MNLQTRKLNLIEYLIGIQDEEIFKTIEDTINVSIKTKEQTLNKFTKDELIKRAQKSDFEYTSGNFKTQEQLEIESQNW